MKIMVAVQANALATVRDTIQATAHTLIFEELILAPFSIARMRENFKKAQKTSTKTPRKVE